MAVAGIGGAIIYLMTDEISSFINSCSPEQQTIIRALRDITQKNIPDAHELIYHGALGYAYSQSPFDRIIYIALATHHTTYGFFFGGQLPDPTHLLEGSGKRMRHVKIKSAADANNPALEELIKAAWKDAQVLVPRRHKKMPSL